MADQHVPTVATPVTAPQLYQALGQAWPLIVGGIPARSSLLVLLAQSAFETGQWADAFNFNFGNVKHVPGDGADYFTIGCDEVVNGQTVHIAACMFRAFPTLGFGSQSYLKTLKKHFKPAWAFVLAGDPVGFVRALKAANYFTGSESDYERGVVAYFNKFNRSIPGGGILPLPVGAPNALGDLVIAAIGGLALGGLGYWAWRDLELGHRRRYA